MSLNPYSELEHVKIGIAITGSFCTFEKMFQQLTLLSNAGADLYPIISYHASKTNSRFGSFKEHIDRIEEITKKKVIDTIEGAEPFGPKIILDFMVILPCTGNTMAKLSHAITDTPALMAAKAHLRNQRPLILAIASNDGLGLNLNNIGILMNSKNIYFVPFGQDDYKNKPNSLVSHMDYLPKTILAARNNQQLQPVLISPYEMES